MYDMIVMRCLKAHACLDGDADRFFYGKTCFFLNVFFQGDSFYQFHHDIMDAVFLSHIVHIHDIGMHQARCGLCFHPELGYEVCIFTEFLLQHLNRDKAVQLMVFCLVDIRHPSGAYFFQDLVSVSQHHSNFNHSIPPAKVPAIYVNGSITMTAILSLPPLSFAAFTSFSAALRTSFFLSMILLICSSSSMSVSPSEHRSTLSPG